MPDNDLPQAFVTNSWRGAQTEEESSAGLFPSRDALGNLERLLTRLQFECEEVGWWPSVPAHPGHPQLTLAPGVLSELVWAYAALLGDEFPQPLGDIAHAPWKMERGDSPSPWGRYVFVLNWDMQWGFEIERVMGSLGRAIPLLIEHWKPVLGDVTNLSRLEGPDGDIYLNAKPSQWLDPAQVGSSALVVPIDLAAALERCARRIRVVLTSGPVASLAVLAEQRKLRALEEFLAQEKLRLQGKSAEDVLWEQIEALYDGPDDGPPKGPGRPLLRTSEVGYNVLT